MLADPVVAIITTRWDEEHRPREVAWNKRATEMEAKVITSEDSNALTTVGLDLGDKTIQACFLDHHGEIVEGFLRNDAIVIQETGVHVLVTHVESHRHPVFIPASIAHD